MELNCLPVYSVLVPVLNEAQNLPFLVEHLDGVLKKLESAYEILIINDAGKDGSFEILESLKIKFSCLHPVYRNTDLGPGYALREGFKRARGEIIITMDGDLSHDPAEIPQLLQGLNDADMVCGSRYIHAGRAELDFSRRMVSKTFNGLSRQLTGIPIRDITSNYRIFRREIIEKISLHHGQFGIFIEIPIKAYFAGFRITERPIHYRQRGQGHSHSNFRQWLEYLKTLVELVQLKPF